jgi:hypothetical protein
LLPNQPILKLHEPAPAKSKSQCNFSEQTLIEDTSKTLEKTRHRAATINIEDPAITLHAYNRAYKTFKDQNYHETIKFDG